MQGCQLLRFIGFAPISDCLTERPIDFDFATIFVHRGRDRNHLMSWIMMGEFLAIYSSRDQSGSFIIYCHDMVNMVN